MPSRTVDPVSSQPNVPATPHEPRRKSYDALFGDAPDEPWRPVAAPEEPSLRRPPRRRRALPAARCTRRRGRGGTRTRRAELGRRPGGGRPRRQAGGHRPAVPLRRCGRPRDRGRPARPPDAHRGGPRRGVEQPRSPCRRRPRERRSSASGRRAGGRAAGTRRGGSGPDRVPPVRGCRAGACRRRGARARAAPGRRPCRGEPWPHLPRRRHGGGRTDPARRAGPGPHLEPDRLAHRPRPAGHELLRGTDGPPPGLLGRDRGATAGVPRDDPRRRGSSRWATAPRWWCGRPSSSSAPWRRTPHGCSVRPRSPRSSCSCVAAEPDQPPAARRSRRSSCGSAKIRRSSAAMTSSTSPIAALGEPVEHARRPGPPAPTRRW